MTGGFSASGQIGHHPLAVGSGFEHHLAALSLGGVHIPLGDFGRVLADESDLLVSGRALAGGVFKAVGAMLGDLSLCFHAGGLDFAFHPCP